VPGPAGNTVASAGNDGTVSLTNLRSAVYGPRVDLKLPPRVSHFRFGPNDELLCNDSFTTETSFSHRESAWIYNLETGRAEHFENSTPWRRVSEMALTPDGTSLLLGHSEGKITIHRRDAPGAFETWDLKEKDFVDQLEFAPDERTLIVRLGRTPGSFRLYDYFTRERLDRDSTRPADEPIVLSRSGRWLVTNQARIGFVWDLRSPAVSAREFVSANSIFALAVSPDESLFASGGESRTIALRRFPTGTVQKELISHQAFVTTLAFSPDGRSLLSGDLAGTVKVWSVQSGRFLFDLARLARKIERIEFSPSGRYLAYSAYHGPLVVLDLQKLKAED
jgi:WD40 repeat protein